MGCIRCGHVFGMHEAMFECYVRERANPREDVAANTFRPLCARCIEAVRSVLLELQKV